MGALLIDSAAPLSAALPPHLAALPRGASPPIRPEPAPSLAAAWTLVALTAATIEPILVKLGYQGHVSPLQLLVVKTAVAGLVVLPLARRWPWHGLQVARRVAPAALLLLTTYALTLLALQSATAVTVITVVTTTPALVALVNQGRGREILAPTFWTGFFLCFLGVALTVQVQRPDALSASPLALACLVGAVLSSTAYRIRIEDLTEEMDPLQVSTALFLVDAVLVLVLVAPFLPPVPATGWAIGIWIGLAAAAANVAFVAALHLVGATRMSLFNLLQRPMVIIAACLVLREPLGLLQVAGIVLTLGGIRLARVRKKPPLPPALQASDRPRSLGTTSTGRR